MRGPLGPLHEVVQSEIRGGGFTTPEGAHGDGRRKTGGIHRVVEEGEACVLLFGLGLLLVGACGGGAATLRAAFPNKVVVEQIAWNAHSVLLGFVVLAALGPSKKRRR